MPPTTAPGPTDPVVPLDTAWHTMAGADTALRLDVDPEQGLTMAEVERRRAEHGPNRLAEAPRRPRWLKFLDQFRSAIVGILIGAAVLAGLVGDLKDTVVIAVVLLLNAVLGYLQEAKAETAMDALSRMLVTRVRVRRDGQVQEVPTEELVPGDLVLLEAGDRVPADGRLLLTAATSIDESALTGESVPVDKHADHLAPDDGGATPLGDRHNVAFMNTTVVRGRAELLVTETGMRTEMGKVAELLNEAEPGPTPLQRQLDKLGTRLAMVAVGAVTLVFVLRIVQGEDPAEAALNAVALAVAAIPEGLPAVVTVTLAIGVSQMAKRNAIVKRLHSVETLGSTSVICSDKTGTLTLNQMTARTLVVGDIEVQVSGEGYGADGRFTTVDDRELPDVGRAVLAGALCSDAEVRDGELVGDPTEGALVAVAQKAGLDVAHERDRLPRVGEVPFDSATKYMATFHRDRDDEVVVFVKGAPDVLVARCVRLVVNEDGDTDERRLDDAASARVRDRNERLAGQGLRVLALASRRLPAGAVIGPDGEVTDPDRWIEDLTLEALVGIVDPPRAEARDAIALCGVAGIDVKMITGDHAATAGAIARELGIRGEVVTGDGLDAMSDEELADRIDGIGVCARVSPTHKVRVVKALQANGLVVAMTGDGVNDAAALRNADIGVAMGITGTEVTKEAGDMVLADDNFATIVGAVERGRTIYDNIVKFVRFQLSTNLGAITTILAASLLGMPTPFTAIQVLWVNIICDGPPAMTLGVDPPDRHVMEHPPRASDAAILSAWRLARLLFFGVVMAIGTLGLFAFADARWGAGVAGTMAFTTFVFFQLFNVFNARLEQGSVFSRYSFTNGKLWIAVGSIALLQIVAIRWSAAEDVFDTTDLDATQFLLCVAVASTVLLAEELRKLVAGVLLRRAPDRTERFAQELRELEAAAIEAELASGRVEESPEEAKRHIAVRIARVTGGAFLVLVGIALLALPGPGLVVLAAGLVLLSADVPFANRLLQRVRKRLPEGEDGQVSKTFIGASVGGGVCLMGLSIWWTLIR